MSNTPLGQPAGAWVQTFGDEFTGPMAAVDATNGLYTFSPGGPTWRVWYEGNYHTNNGAGGACWYDERGVSVTGGVLSLTAIPTASNGKPFIGGVIQSAPSYLPAYGYAEARIKQPGVDNSWPAFWMYSTQAAHSCEFDIMENSGTGQGSQYTLTTWRNNTNGSAGDLYAHAVSTSITGWHTYGCSWTPDGLVFYLDGVEVARDTNPLDVPQEQMSIVLDIQVQTGANTALYPAALQVDWLRFYKSAATPRLRAGSNIVDRLYLGSAEVGADLLPL